MADETAAAPEAQPATPVTESAAPAKEVLPPGFLKNMVEARSADEAALAAEDEAAEAEEVAEEPAEAEAEPATEEAVAEAEEAVTEEAPAEPAEDPRLAALKSQLDAVNEQLQQYRNAEQQAKDTQELNDIKSALAEVSEEYGEDSKIAKALGKMMTAVEKAIKKSDAATQATVANTELSAHQRAMSEAPVMNAIFKAKEANPNDRAAIRLWNTANTYSEEIMDEAGLESINWRNAKALAKHYAEIEKRITADMPGLRAKFFPGPKADAKTETKPAPKLEVKPAKVKGPTTMSGMAGGTTPQPAGPVNIGQMNRIDLVRLASGASAKQMQAIRSGPRG